MRPASLSPFDDIDAVIGDTVVVSLSPFDVVVVIAINVCAE